jgi:hypothetical protein
MFAAWLAQTAHAYYPTWSIAVQQAAGPVLRIRKWRAPPTILDDMGPFGHTREIERPAPAPRSVGDSTSVTTGRPLVVCGSLRLSGFDLQAVWLCDVDTRVLGCFKLHHGRSTQ